MENFAVQPLIQLSSSSSSIREKNTDDIDNDPFELPEDLRRIAEEELGETPSVRKFCLIELRQLIEKLPPNEQLKDSTDDALLIQFLRAKKFRVKDALKVYHNYAIFKRDNPELFENRSGEEFRAMYRAGFMRILHGRTRKGHVVSLLVPKSMGDWTEFDAKTMLRWSTWSMERLSRDPYIQVCGLMILENFEGFSFLDNLKMSTSMPPSMMSKSFHFMQKCLPARIGGIHVFHPPIFISILMAMVMPFMSKKMKERCFLHRHGIEGIEEIMDMKDLPSEFGGTLEEDPMAWLEEEIKKETEEKKQ